MDKLFANLLHEATVNKIENELYLKNITSQGNEANFQELKSIHTSVFNRTDCLSCANCCRTTPALVTLEDVRRIGRSLGLSAKQFLKQYVLEDYNGEMTLNGVPCRFLGDDNSCTIYEIRPEACRRYPHTDEKQYFKRTYINLANTVICPAAYQILEQLKKVISLP
jgi:Fe-S-cluster containining protein